MTGLYPILAPYEHGLLPVGDGHEIYWEVCGNPRGSPALVLHGGPGSGCRPWHRQLFDPAAYRVVLFDQRNCGRSVPYAGEPVVDLSANTTNHQLADIERLREHLGVADWLVLGASWGSVLGLRYAQTHRDHVRGLVLYAIATGRQVEVDLLTRGLRGMFEHQWQAFSAAAGATEDLPRAYHALLMDRDSARHDAAALAWCAWEDAIAGNGPSRRFDDRRFRLAFARLVTHYWSNGHFLDHDVVLRDADQLRGIPGVLVQGVLDLGNLVGTPWLLAHAWPEAELVMIEDVGHSGDDPLVAEVIRATDRLAVIPDRPDSS